MVFLRLEVKVFPREQVSSSSGLLRSLIGNNGDRTRDEAVVPKKFASFLLAVDKPEDVTLGDLACMILDEWRMLRPDQEPLAIKKLLDDANPSVDLNVGLTVEDVFVDRGKARVDGHDQRATVRVIQKPTAHCPERFPSVVQDWDGAVQESKRRRSMTKKEEIAKQISPIAEEEDDVGDIIMRDSPVEPRDVPVSSVETHETTTNGEPEPEPVSDATPGTRPFDGHESQKLGFPSPPAREERPSSQSRKRKQSPEEEAPVKNPRLEENTTPTRETTQQSPQQPNVQSPQPPTETTPVSTPSPLRKKNRIPSFASPHGRRLSASEKQVDAQKQGLGLGVTKSPSTVRTVMLDMPSSQPSPVPPLFPSSAPSTSTPLGQNNETIVKTSQSLQSAMRKNTPLNKNHQRRSVSFANGNGIAQEIHEPQSTPQNNAPAKASQNTPTASGTPSSSQIRYPPGFSLEKIQKIKAQVEQDSREVEAVEAKLNDPNTDPRCLSPLKQMAGILAEIGRSNKDSRKVRDLRKKLAGPRKKIQTFENKAREKEKDSASSTEPPLPPSASKVDRSIPVSNLNGSTSLDITSTWSFASASNPISHRRSSVASSNGTHEPARSHDALQEANESSGAKAPSPMSKSAAPTSKPSRKSPVKTDTQTSSSVVKPTPPGRGSKEINTDRLTTKSPQKPKVIEVASTDEEEDEGDESSDDEGEDDEGSDDDGDEGNDGDEEDEEDEEETEGPTTVAEQEPVPGKDSQELAGNPAKRPAKSLIDGEAEEASEEDDEDESSDEGGEEESEESSDDGSTDEEESSDDSSDDDKAVANGDDKPEANSKGLEPELDLPPATSLSRTTAKSTTKSPAQPSQPPASQQTPAAKATLKGLLKSQRAEAAARQKQPPLAVPPPAEKEKRDVYDVPSSESESESDSDSDDSDDENGDHGDILPSGDSGKLRKPWSLRK